MVAGGSVAELVAVGSSDNDVVGDAVGASSKLAMSLAVAVACTADDGVSVA